MILWMIFPPWLYEEHFLDCLMLNVRTLVTSVVSVRTYYLEKRERMCGIFVVHLLKYT